MASLGVGTVCANCDQAQARGFVIIRVLLPASLVAKAARMLTAGCSSTHVHDANVCLLYTSDAADDM
eukprot:5271726-Alexandrium_andersonii.AAC.1